MKIKEKAIIFSLLAISPLGVPFLYMILDATGLCVSSTGGGMVTSVTCSVPFGSYLAWAGEQFTNSFLLVVPGILWLIASVTIGVYTLLYGSLFLLGKGNESKLDANKISIFGSKQGKPQSFLAQIFQAIILLVVIVVAVVAIVVAADHFGLV